jgi:hypothetical protein
MANVLVVSILRCIIINIADLVMLHYIRILNPSIIKIIIMQYIKLNINFIKQNIL